MALFLLCLGENLKKLQRPPRGRSFWNQNVARTVGGGGQAAAGLTPPPLDSAAAGGSNKNDEGKKPCEVEREAASSYVKEYLVVDSALTKCAAAVQAIAALCDVHRAAVGLDPAGLAVKRR